ncbi:MAG: flavoprotein [Planctomycetota bacterium]
MSTNAPPKRLLIAVTGGIAAYKTCHVVSRLSQAGHDVRVIMTDAATRFVGPATFQALSGHPVMTSAWAPHPDASFPDPDPLPDLLSSPHVALARWCDLILIAPASADCLARLAAGLTDDLVALTASALPSATPLVVAPAMNADMWANPIVQRNLATLRDALPNLTQLGPDDGWQACRTSGQGRMMEPEAIVEAVIRQMGTADERG